MIGIGAESVGRVFGSGKGMGSDIGRRGVGETGIRPATTR